jgi:hypothetical protein
MKREKDRAQIESDEVASVNVFKTGARATSAIKTIIEERINLDPVQGIREGNQLGALPTYLPTYG